jgi:primase-polymerase (primpol)-like protein
MTPSGCGHCGGDLPLLARSDAQYCSTRCRVAAHRARRGRVPDELRGAERWVRYSPTKVPLRADSDDPASATDPTTWASHDVVLRSKVGAGPGFVLNGDGIVCLDLDGCLDERGVPVGWVLPILDALPPTWIEVSPSGRGLHVWGRGDVRRGWRRPFLGHQVEAYGTGRYITVTGRAFQGSPLVLADLSAVLADLS